MVKEYINTKYNLSSIGVELKKTLDVFIIPFFLTSSENVQLRFDPVLCKFNCVFINSPGYFYTEGNDILNQFTRKGE